MNSISIRWDEFLLSFSSALDLLSPVVVDHHYDVAYRESLKPGKVKEALRYFVDNHYLDSGWVKIALEHQSFLAQENRRCQEEALAEYNRFQREIPTQGK